jgi:fructose-1,6-bisphosphatase II
MVVGCGDGILLDRLVVELTSSLGARTSSLVVRGLSGTVRQINSTHRWEKLRKISAIEY